MIFNIQTETDKGPVRVNNEDAIAYGVWPEAEGFWMVLADGMGGHKAGEVASQLLIDRISSKLASSKPKPSSWTDFIEESISLANKDIFEAAQSNPERLGMGTTCVLVIAEGESLHIGWVGDSRAYLFRNGKLKQLTTDHTMIQYLLDKGSITAEEAARSNTKHLLAKAVGVKVTVEVDTLTIFSQPEDTIMLTSDGVHDFSAEAVLAGFLTRAETGDKIVKSIVADAISQGSKDNLTVGIIAAMNTNT